MLDVISVIKMVNWGILDYFKDFYLEILIKDNCGWFICVKNFG